MNDDWMFDLDNDGYESKEEKEIEHSIPEEEKPQIDTNNDGVIDSKELEQYTPGINTFYGDLLKEDEVVPTPKERNIEQDKNDVQGFYKDLFGEDTPETPEEEKKLVDLHDIDEYYKNLEDIPVEEVTKPREEKGKNTIEREFNDFVDQVGEEERKENPMDNLVAQVEQRIADHPLSGILQQKLEAKTTAFGKGRAAKEVQQYDLRGRLARGMASLDQLKPFLEGDLDDIIKNSRSLDLRTPEVREYCEQKFGHDWVKSQDRGRLLYQLGKENVALARLACKRLEKKQFDMGNYALVGAIAKGQVDPKEYLQLPQFFDKRGKEWSTLKKKNRMVAFEGLDQISLNNKIRSLLTKKYDDKIDVSELRDVRGLDLYDALKKQLGIAEDVKETPIDESKYVDPEDSIDSELKSIVESNEDAIENKEVSEVTDDIPEEDKKDIQKEIDQEYDDNPNNDEVSNDIKDASIIADIPDDDETEAEATEALGETIDDPLADTTTQKSMHDTISELLGREVYDSPDDVPLPPSTLEEEGARLSEEEEDNKERAAIAKAREEKKALQSNEGYRLAQEEERRRLEAELPDDEVYVAPWEEGIDFSNETEVKLTPEEEAEVDMRNAQAEKEYDDYVDDLLDGLEGVGKDHGMWSREGLNSIDPDKAGTPEDRNRRVDEWFEYNLGEEYVIASSEKQKIKEIALDVTIPREKKRGMLKALLRKARLPKVGKWELTTPDASVSGRMAQVFGNTTPMTWEEVKPTLQRSTGKDMTSPAGSVTVGGIKSGTINPEVSNSHYTFSNQKVNIPASGTSTTSQGSSGGPIGTQFRQMVSGGMTQNTSSGSFAVGGKGKRSFGVSKGSAGKLSQFKIPNLSTDKAKTLYEKILQRIMSKYKSWPVEGDMYVLKKGNISLKVQDDEITIKYGSYRRVLLDTFAKAHPNLLVQVYEVLQ